MDPQTGEVVELLQALIRNACVNDGTVTSGGEARSADLLAGVLEGSGCAVERYEPQPGRTSVLARIEGSDPAAPGLLLMGHTDVVPANPDGWSRDPFGGELVDGFVWGRGAIDMLNLTSSMAVAFARLARSGFTPRGTIGFLGVADEEALGTWGAQWLVEHQLDDVRFPYVITESGGVPAARPDGIRLPVVVAEKGSHWCTLRVAGTPGHASQPFRTDNALVTAAEVVRRLAAYRPRTDIHETWRRYVEGMGFAGAQREALLDAEGLYDHCATLPVGIGRNAHACTHTTIAPTVVRGGVKTNVIPDAVELDLDIRTLPGQRSEDVDALLSDALGDLADRVTVVRAHHDESTASPVDTPLWAALQRVSSAFYPRSAVVPTMTVGATDARFFRQVGATAYGFGLFSRALRYEDHAVMFHGDDERVDVESLRLSTEMWTALAHDLLG